MDGSRARKGLALLSSVGIGVGVLLLVISLTMTIIGALQIAGGNEDAQWLVRLGTPFAIAAVAVTALAWWGKTAVARRAEGV